MTDLVSQAAGVSEDNARLVAEIAQGFPKLAVEIARSLAEVEAGTISEILQQHRVEDLLRRMLPDEAARRNVAHLALFDRLGFEGELGFETEGLCRAFDLDEVSFRTAVTNETGRFVSTAGRYRRVTPKAFAVWLVREIASADPGGFTSRLVQLPQELFEAFRRQIEILGGDPLMDAVLEEVVAQRAEWFRGPDGLTSEGARLLNALAYAVPELAANEIHGLVASQSVEELRAIGDDRRRELVWALDHLLWFESTFELAAESLLKLAVAENENYANNARGTFGGAFLVHLGGTEVPYDQRIAWLREHASDLGDASLRESVLAVDGAFTIHETRIGGWRGARLQPIEWRPKSREEDQTARLLAWRYIRDTYTAHPQIEEAVVGALCSAARTIVEFGIGDEFLAWLPSQMWSDVARARLSGSLRQTLAYAKDLPEALRNEIEAVVHSLEGQDLPSRLASLVLTEYWELAESLEEKREGPEILLTLAEACVREATVDQLLAAQDVEGAKDHTVYELFRNIGLRDEHASFEPLAHEAAASSAARVGYLAGRAQGDFEWADRIFQEWASDDRLAADLPRAISALPASPERIELAVQVVRSDLAPLWTLNGFMYGGWSHGLPPESIQLLIETYLASELSENELDAIMSLLSFWLGADNEPTPTIRQLGQQLIERASTMGRTQVGLDYVRNSLSDQLDIDATARLTALLEALRRESFPSAEDMNTLVALTEQEPETVVREVTRFILSDNEGWSLYLQTSHLLSLMGRAGAVDRVVAEILSFSPDDQLRLLSHIDFTREEPDEIFIRLFENLGDSEEFRETSTSRYLFPGEVVSGPYSQYLEVRRDRILNWGVAHPSMAAWADDVAKSLEGWIGTERLREEERGY